MARTKEEAMCRYLVGDVFGRRYLCGQDIRSWKLGELWHCLVCADDWQCASTLRADRSGRTRRQEMTYALGGAWRTCRTSRAMRSRLALAQHLLSDRRTRQWQWSVPSVTIFSNSAWIAPIAASGFSITPADLPRVPA